MPHRLVLDTLAAVHPRRQPYMVRGNYAREVRSALTFPLAAALAEGTFTGVVASKYFGGGMLLIAVITAAPMFGNILALLWSELAEGRPKIPFINLLQVGVVAAMALVGLTYFIDDPALAGWTFAGLVIIARVLASGIITLRSAVWRMNFPRALRGQIIARVNGIYNLVLAAAVLVSAAVLDGHPGLYAVVYPAIALVSLLGVREYARVRVRGEGAVLRRLRAVPAAASETLAEGATLDYARVDRINPGIGPLRRLGLRLRDALALLRSDRVFREYQWWQFLLGASFMMMFPTLIYVVSSEMTDRTTQYVLAVIVLQAIPMITGVVFLQVWAPAFDRVDLFTFRVWIGAVALVTHGLILTGAVTGQLWVVALGTFSVGVSMGGGQLAWQLGQNAFATKANVGTYMGLHVMLTGLRGMFVPFVGVGLYHLLDRSDVLGDHSGRWVFAVPVALCLTSLFGYLSMARRYRGMSRETDDGPAPWGGGGATAIGLKAAGPIKDAAAVGR